MKGRRLGAAALIAGLVAALIALIALPAGARTTDESRALTVSAVGTVKAVPDTVEWSFGVQTEAATAKEALRTNGVEMAKVIAALKAAGIPAQDLRTQQVSLFPRMSEDGRRVIGYTASNTVGAIVRDIAKAGAVVDAAAEAGANQISGPSLTLSNADVLYEQALEKAYDKALAKARRLAKRAGVSLRRPISIVEGGGIVPVPLAEAAKAAGGGTPIEPGQTEISASVTVTFAIS